MTVVVVGGGVVGACCAYYLAKAGCTVTVVDRGRFGAACSHANCGYVCPSHVLPLAGPGAFRTAVRSVFRRNSPLKIHAGTVLRDPGWFLRFAVRCRSSHQTRAAHALRAMLASGRRLYDELLANEGIACDWQHRGLLFVFRTAAGFAHYAATDELLRTRFDTPARRLDAAELASFEPAVVPGLAGGYLYEWDAHLRPDRLMAELRRVLAGQGVTIRENVEVSSVADARRFGERVVLATGALTPRLLRSPVQPGKGYSLTYPPFAGMPTTPMIFEEAHVAVTSFADGFRVGSTMEFGGYDEAMSRDRLRLLTDGMRGCLRVPPPDPPSSTNWLWAYMLFGAPLPAGLPSVAPVSSVPSQTPTTHCGVCHTRRVIAPPGVLTRFRRSTAS